MTVLTVLHVMNATFGSIVPVTELSKNKPRVMTFILFAEIANTRRKILFLHSRSSSANWMNQRSNQSNNRRLNNRPPFWSNQRYLNNVPPLLELHQLERKSQF